MPFSRIPFIAVLLLYSVAQNHAFLDRLFGKRHGHRERPGFYYEVRSGDNFYSLSRRFNVSVDALKNANRISGSILPRKTIWIPRSTYVLRPDRQYEEHPHPREPVKQSQTDYTNSQIKPERSQSMSKDKLKKIEEKETKAQFFWPVTQPKMLKGGGFGATNGDTRNAGILLQCDRAEVRPSRKGKLVFQGNLDGYGKTVILDHLDDYFTIYAHLSNIKRYKEGQWISREKLIGYTGKVGSTGEEALHFEVRYLNQALDPLLFLDRSQLNHSESKQ